ncbi:MAG TPA: c-type cytochrome [Geminicoccaceae bacterium]|nr:c-type cytochrome [Geminicoccaceae bacterium]
MARGVGLLGSLLLVGVAGAVAALALVGPDGRAPPPELVVAGGDPERGKNVIRRSGCSACHVIPGIAGADGLVGPPLDRFARRAYVGGVLPNRPQNLVAWLIDPPAIDALTAMPAPGISAAEARDVAAYLYGLH